MQSNAAFHVHPHWLKLHSSFHKIISILYISALNCSISFVAMRLHSLNASSAHFNLSLNSIGGAIYDQMPSLTELKFDETALLYPGGSTACLSNSKFAFKVIKGQAEKVILFFPGGGLCWDEKSTKEKQCTMTVAHDRFGGIFARNQHNESKFRNFTIIIPLYCSGDSFLGNTTRSNKGPGGDIVRQRGLLNALSVIDWLTVQQQQHHDGFIAPVLSELFVMGTSAGGTAALFLSSIVLSSLHWRNAAIVSDSMLPLAPPGAAAYHLLNGFAICNGLGKLLPPAFALKCHQPTISLGELLAEVARLHPQVPIAFLFAKRDPVLQLFLNLIGAHGGYINQPITNAEFYFMANQFLQLMVRKIPNGVAYIVDDKAHVFLTKALYFTANAASSSGKTVFNGRPSLSQWLEQLPLYSKEIISSVCNGDEYQRVKRNGSIKLLMRTEVACRNPLLNASISTQRCHELRPVSTPTTTGQRKLVTTPHFTSRRKALSSDTASHDTPPTNLNITLAHEMLEVVYNDSHHLNITKRRVNHKTTLLQDPIKMCSSAIRRSYFPRVPLKSLL